MRALIDADGIIFRSGFAVEHKKYKYFIKGEEHLGPFQIYQYKKEIPKEFHGDEGIHCVEESTIEPLQNCLHLVRQEIEGIISATDANSYSVYIKGKGNFREEISVTRVYKGNRDVAHRPVYEEEIRKYLKDHWGAIEVDGMEVDDKVAIEQMNFYVHEEDNGGEGLCTTIICSMDKDLNQIPGWHYNYAKKEKYWVTEDEARRTFYIQLLSGDASDNIQGVKGLGPAKAKRLIDECTTEAEMYEVSKQEYLKCYGEIGLEIMYEMANLIWIRREEPITEWSPCLT